MHEYVCYKWKWQNELTIDFKVRRDDVDQAANRGARTVPGSVRYFQNDDIKVGTVRLLPREAKKLLRDHRGARSFVLECRFAVNEGLWRLVRVRTDKARGNHAGGAFATLEMMAENLTPEVLGRELSRRWEAKKVAGHYDAIQALRDSSKAKQSSAHDEDPIGVMRKLNNWIKGSAYRVTVWRICVASGFWAICTRPRIAGASLSGLIF